MDALLGDIEEGRDEGTIQPVSLVLLDIHMPILSGIEAFKLIKDKYLRVNEKLSQAGSSEVVKPLICYLSQVE